MSALLALGVVALAVGYLWVGARHWSRIMSVPATSTAEIALDAAWARRGLRVRLFQITFTALWPAFLALGAINAAIESRRPA